MALSTVVTDLEQIDESIREHYAEQEIDGETVYVLQLTEVDSHPEVRGLSGAYQSEKQKRQKMAEAKRELDRLKAQMPEDFDPEEWKRLKEQAQNAGDDDRVRQIQQEWQRKVEEAEQRAQAAEQKLRTTTVERALSEALEAAGVTRPALKRGAASLLRDQVQLNDDGEAAMETRLGPRPVSEAVKQWVQTEEGAEFVAPATGSGAKGSTGSGGQRKRFEQMTGAELAELRQKDPQEYQRLRDEYYGR